MAEKLTPKWITPMTQSMEAGCVPTSISMVFSGFGIDISEHTLIDRYFPTARLPLTDPHVGVSNTKTVTGMVQIIEDLGLRESLQVDVFDPYLWEYTKSKDDKYIVNASPRALRRKRNRFKGVEDMQEFYNTLEWLVKDDDINVLTTNSRMMHLKSGSRRYGSLSIMPDYVSEGFYAELNEFIRKGHIVGPHGGMTAHTRALDGSRMEKLSYRSFDEKGYMIVDPRGESYAISTHSLIWVDSRGARGDVFDYLFRVSPREADLSPHNFGFRRFIQNLRHLIP